MNYQNTTTPAPRTMTHVGLAFLEALAAQVQNGCILEIGPLFGSSTQALAKGRKTTDTPMHSIDTFEAAPWVRKRFGFDLSREKFDEHTQDISNLTVHQGFSPDVVKNTWSHDIGMYFDDATHGDPGWSDNLNFFRPFFKDDTIICGDDFAGGWPDIVQNVYNIARAEDIRLFIMGRVWALAKENDQRIVNAVNSIFPDLSEIIMICHRDKGEIRNPAAVWSWGVHTNVALTSFGIETGGKFKGALESYRGKKLLNSVPLDGSQLDLTSGNRFTLRLASPVDKTKPETKIQYCTVDKAGRTQNTKSLSSGQFLDLPETEKITAIRLT